MTNTWLRIPTPAQATSAGHMVSRSEGQSLLLRFAVLGLHHLCAASIIVSISASSISFRLLALNRQMM